MRRLALVCAAVAVAAVGAAQTGSSSSITGRVLVSPLSVSVLVPTDPVRAGREFRIRAEVVNAGSVAVHEVEIRLVRDPAIVLYDPVRQVLDRVGPGRDRRVTWDACARRPGSYVVLVRATTAALQAESAGAVLEITDARRPTC
jgi:hypothetical protein